MVAGTISLGFQPLQARERIHQEVAREMVRQGEMLSLEQLLQRHGERLAGQLLDVELEREHGRLVYEIEVLGQDGQVREFEIDARSGELLKQRLEE